MSKIRNSIPNCTYAVTILNHNILMQHICSNNMFLYIIMATPIPINSATYDALNTSIIDILKSGNYASISIFVDASGNEYHRDEYGNIQDRIILGITRTDSYTDNSGNLINAQVTITFQELQGSPGGKFKLSLKTVDSIDSHWYILTPVPLPSFEFGR